jgi:hypothetical protein
MLRLAVVKEKVEISRNTAKYPQKNSHLPSIMHAVNGRLNPPERSIQRYRVPACAAGVSLTSVQS